MEIQGKSKPYVGGQAVLEGVMMRSPRCLAVAVRRPDGTIAVREDAWVSLWEKLKFLRWPVLRGTVVLVESLMNGLTALGFSADQAALAEGAAGPTASAGPRSAPIVRNYTPPEAPTGTAGTIAVSILLAIGLFVGLPHLLAWGTGRAVGASLDVDSFGFHALDGLFKIAIFVGYIAAISMVPEIRRVFQYHGAEHKVVNVYEDGEELTLDNAKVKTTFHARCGTSFVLFVLTLSIFMFAAIFPFVPRVSELALVNHFAMIVLKIPLMLPLAGLAYEINRFASMHPGQLWVQAIVFPGRLMQRLTTREPDDDQLEIALAAMRAALARDAALATAPAAARDPAVAVFASYGELTRAIPSTRTVAATASGL